MLFFFVYNHQLSCYLAIQVVDRGQYNILCNIFSRIIFLCLVIFHWTSFVNTVQCHALFFSKKKRSLFLQKKLIMNHSSFTVCYIDDYLNRIIYIWVPSSILLRFQTIVKIKHLISPFISIFY